MKPTQLEYETVHETRPAYWQPQSRREARPDLRTSNTSRRIVLERSDICFRSSTQNRLRVEITLRNQSREASAPTLARVSAAPLGAFVSWEPLFLLPVPAIPPGGTVRLAGDGTPSLRRPPATPRRLSGAALFLLSTVGLRLQSTDRSPHWAGNVDVLIHDRDVERHAAFGLQLMPGVTNLADFVVGDSADDYMFDVTGDIAGWDIRLHPATHPLASFRRREIPLGSWISLPGRRLLWLAARPPRHCSGGKVNVHVCQRSVMREAVVEFEFAG